MLRISLRRLGLAGTGTHRNGKTVVIRGKYDHSLKLWPRAIQRCHESRPPKTAGSKKRAFERSTGSAGGPTSPSGSGEPSAKITARTGRPGNFSRTITHARAPTAGEKTASAGFSTVTRLCVFPWGYGIGATPF